MFPQTTPCPSFFTIHFWVFFISPYNQWQTEVTGVAFLNIPPIFNALGALRCTYHASLNIPVSLLKDAWSKYFLNLTHPNFILFNFFPEQGRRNDLNQQKVYNKTTNDHHLSSSDLSVVIVFTATPWLRVLSHPGGAATLLPIPARK